MTNTFKVFVLRESFCLDKHTDIFTVLRNIPALQLKAPSHGAVDGSRFRVCLAGGRQITVFTQLSCHIHYLPDTRPRITLIT